MSVMHNVAKSNKSIGMERREFSNILCVLQISWMRKRDLHILTSSIYTYTGDGRFSVSHPETSDEWKLKIAYVQPRDAGIYECQINTEPKLNLAFKLRVEGEFSPRLQPLSLSLHGWLSGLYFFCPTSIINCRIRLFFNVTGLITTPPVLYIICMVHRFLVFFCFLFV